MNFLYISFPGGITKELKAATKKVSHFFYYGKYILFDQFTDQLSNVDC